MKYLITFKKVPSTGLASSHVDEKECKRIIQDYIDNYHQYEIFQVLKI